MNPGCDIKKNIDSRYTNKTKQNYMFILFDVKIDRFSRPQMFYVNYKQKKKQSKKKISVSFFPLIFPL